MMSAIGSTKVYVWVLQFVPSLLRNVVSVFLVRDTMLMAPVTSVWLSTNALRRVVTVVGAWVSERRTKVKLT